MPNIGVVQEHKPQPRMEFQGTSEKSHFAAKWCICMQGHLLIHQAFLLVRFYQAYLFSLSYIEKFTVYTLCPSTLLVQTVICRIFYQIQACRIY